MALCVKELIFCLRIVMFYLVTLQTRLFRVTFSFETSVFVWTGFLPPSGGTAYINGLDMRRDMVKIRENLGLCPQHNVLFDTMTVEEHLTFFAKV